MWKFGALVALFCGVTSGYRAGDSECVVSESNSCAANAIEPSALDGSVLIYPGGETRCAFDDYTGTNGFNTNATYFFQVFPNQDQDKKKLLLFFQGGGACFDSDTCNFSLQCSLGTSATFSTSARALSTGIFNRSNEANLFRDWNVVHIPYCTGDLHVGNAVYPAPAVGVEVILGQKQCLNLNKTMHMSGYANSLAALNWARENFPDPDQIVLGGASAGSLGSQAFSAFVADLWGLGESSKYSLLPDSYVGVVPVDTDSSVILDFFGACDVDLKAPAEFATTCKAHTETISSMISGLMKEIPYSDWLFISSKNDTTQRTFYAFLAQGILGFPFDDLISQDEFMAGVNKIIDVYESVSSKVTTFFVEGSQHVFLNSEGYASVVSDTGVVLGDALKELLGLTPSSGSGSSTDAPTTTPSTTTATPSTTTATPSTTTATPSTTTATPSTTTTTPSTTTTTPSTTTTTPSITTATPSTPTTTPSTTTAHPVC